MEVVLDLLNINTYGGVLGILSFSSLFKTGKSEVQEHKKFVPKTEWPYHTHIFTRHLKSQTVPVLHVS